MWRQQERLTSVLLQTFTKLHSFTTVHRDRKHTSNWSSLLYINKWHGQKYVDTGPSQPHERLSQTTAIKLEAHNGLESLQFSLSGTRRPKHVPAWQCPGLTHHQCLTSLMLKRAQILTATFQYLGASHPRGVADIITAKGGLRIGCKRQIWVSWSDVHKPWAIWWIMMNYFYASKFWYPAAASVKLNLLWICSK